MVELLSSFRRRVGGKYVVVKGYEQRFLCGRTYVCDGTYRLYCTVACRVLLRYNPPTTITQKLASY